MNVLELNENNMAKNSRISDYNINPLLLNRWSPRSMSGKSIDNTTLSSLFEAARWAPSSSNSQPWRFIYTMRESKEWEKFLNLVMEGNRVWAKNAAVLMVVISRRNYEHNEKFSRTHQLDTGSAWENMALEASSRGLAIHGMAGFDYEKAKMELEIPDEFEVMMMIAVGEKDSPEKLPIHLREREVQSDRKPVSELIMKGKFQNNVK